MKTKITCPTCGDDSFDSETNMKIHHTKVHGESIAKDTATCEVCEATFEYYPDSDEAGRFCSGSCRDIFLSECSLNEHPRAGQEHDEETIQKISEKKQGQGRVERVESVCEVCGDTFVHRSTVDRVVCSGGCRDDLSKERLLNITPPHVESGHTQETIEKMCEVKIGENNPMWQGGPSHDYGGRWYSAREKALDRDGHECLVCGDAEDLHVHHLIPVREFDDSEDAHYLENLMTVCVTCHPKVEKLSRECGSTFVREVYL